MFSGLRFAASATVMTLVAGCATVPPATPPTAPPTAAPALQPAQAPTAKPGLTLAAVGDIMPGTDFPENILPDDDGMAFFDDVAPLLSAADLTFGNFEGVLLDGGEPVKQCKNKSVCFLFP